ncbi:MAG: PQQ-binding-like beta-propeller repeat protein [Pseudorhodobacter sp.]
MDMEPPKVNLLLKLLGVVGILFGLAITWPGLLLALEGGSWFFLAAGFLTAASGLLIFRGKERGIYLYIGVCLLAVIWSFWDVWPLETWFWPLIPRLFAFFVALFAVLLLAPLMPRIRGDGYVQAGFLGAALIVLIGLGVTVWQMFSPHGVVSNGFARAEGVAISQAALDMGDEWHNYGRTTTGTRFTPADQINRDNIDRLQVAWTYRTGFFADGSVSDQNTPIYANGTVYACTPFNEIHAIDPVSGERKWVYTSNSYAPFAARCRSVTYYEIPDATGICAKRLATATIDARLISIDAETGKPCEEFGEGGIVDMREGMDYFQPAVYMSNSAPTISHGKIVSGGMAVDNYKVGEPSGVVRAWDARTGELAWAWDVGRPGQTGPLPEGEKYTPFTPNVWTHMAVDQERGLIYLPTGNATPDVWLGHRRDFDHEYTATIVALDINTGQEKWHFRTVNKDVWDYDLPAQPSLYDLPDPASAGNIPVLVLPTKRGQLFMLNRETGEPVAEVVDREVDISGAVPEMQGLSPVQPYSVGMPAIGGEALTEADMWGVTPIDLALCRRKFHQLRYSDDEFTVPNLEPGLFYPSALGGMNWGSASIDESRGLLFVNDLRIPMVIKLLTREEVPNEQWPKDGHELIAPQLGTPYGLQRDLMMSALGILCMRPPYGTLTAIDLNSREILWQRPVGTTENLDFIGVQTGIKMPIGMPTLGGSLATASGLLFFDNAGDHYLRIFDSETGDILREIPIPVGATATPMSYIGPDGKQYVVISVGGSSSAVSAFRGDYVIAYSLE